MTVQIFYDDDEITNSVLFATASFESQLGAQPGSFEFTVKDPTQTLSFTTGKHVRLEVDGTKLFGGFVFQVGKRFAFPVADTVTNGPEDVDSRYWVIRGVDYNILFDKRFLFNVANPREIIPKATGNLQDGQIVELLTSSYLDLSDDDIDTTTSVLNVGDPQAGASDYGFHSVGTAWRKEMGAVSAKTGAIWYIGPGSTTKMKLYYRGRETFTPGWGFSDTPDGVTTFGFRELDVTEDSSNLVNDALVWGGNQYGVVGTGADLRFGRSQDQDSIDELFRSQRAEAYFGDEAYLTDEDCENRANVIVWGRADGDPQPGAIGEDSADPARGLRFPQRFLRLSWFGDQVPTVLIPGAVVTVYLSTFDEEITLPVRSIRIRFEGAPWHVRYDAFLGIQTDDPFKLWKYMTKVSERGGTAGTATGTGSAVTPVSDGSAPATVAGTQVSMVPTPTPNGTTTIFTLRDAYQPGSTKVWVNGLRWRVGVEYIESSPTLKTIQFYDAPLSGDQLWVTYTSSGL